METNFNEIRRRRRSFEEKLRKELLTLECVGKEIESRILIHHLENILYKTMSEFREGGTWK